MKWNKIKIKESPKDFNLTMDGVVIHGVTKIEYSSEVGEIPMLKLEMYVGEIEIEIDEEGTGEN